MDIEGGVSDLVAIREELMIATTDGRDEVQSSSEGSFDGISQINLWQMKICLDLHG